MLAKSYKPVRGTRDLMDCKIYSEIHNIFRKHMQLYAFDEIQFPILEHKDFYISAGHDTDLVKKEMFTVSSSSKENNDSDMVLRGEGTISCIRAAINSGIANQRKKLFYMGPMFRYNRPQKNRLREFTQLGCEYLNANHIIYECEIIQCLVEFLGKLGISPIVHVNTLCSKKTLNIYKEKVYKFLVDNQDKLLDQSRNNLHHNVLRLIDKLTPEEKNRLDSMPHIIDCASINEQNDFNNLISFMRANNIKHRHDPFLVRGLDYYTTTIFELFSFCNNNAIAGGGRYSTIYNVNGIGWGIGLDRILDEAKITLNKPDLYVVFALNRDYALRIAGILRKHEYTTEIIIGKDFVDCIKRSQILNPKFIIICDDEDARKQEIRIRNWHTKKESVLSTDQINRYSISEMHNL